MVVISWNFEALHQPWKVKGSFESGARERRWEPVRLKTGMGNVVQLEDHVPVMGEKRGKTGWGVNVNLAFANEGVPLHTKQVW